MKKLKLILAVCASIVMLSDTVCAKRFNKADVSNFWTGGAFGGFKNELDKIKEFLYRTTDAYAVKQKLSQNDRVTLTDDDKKQLVEMILSILLADPEFSNTRDPNFKLRATGPTDEELDIIIRSLFRAKALNPELTLGMLSNYLKPLNLTERTHLEKHRFLLLLLYFHVVMPSNEVDRYIQTQKGNPYEIQFFSKIFEKLILHHIGLREGILDLKSENTHLINLIKRWDAYIKAGGTAQHSEW